MQQNLLVKKLLYKSSNRGWKENDILLGGFARKYLTKMSEDELQMFDKLLDESDIDIFAWITNKKLTPAALDNIVMSMLKEFHRDAK